MNILWWIGELACWSAFFSGFLSQVDRLTVLRDDPSQLVGCLIVGVLALVGGAVVCACFTTLVGGSLLLFICGWNIKHQLRTKW